MIKIKISKVLDYIANYGLTLASSSSEGNLQNKLKIMANIKEIGIDINFEICKISLYLYFFKY